MMRSKGFFGDHEGHRLRVALVVRQAAVQFHHRKDWNVSRGRGCPCRFINGRDVPPDRDPLSVGAHYVMSSLTTGAILTTVREP